MNNRIIYRRNRVEALLFGLPMLLMGTAALAAYLYLVFKDYKKSLLSFDSVTLLCAAVIPGLFVINAWIGLIFLRKRHAGILSSFIAMILAWPVLAVYCGQSARYKRIANLLSVKEPSYLLFAFSLLIVVVVAVVFLTLLPFYIYYAFKAYKVEKEKRKREQWGRSHSDGPSRNDRATVQELPLEVRARMLYCLPEHFSMEQLRAGKKRLALLYHPDQPGGSEEMMREVNACYEVLQKVAL